MHKTLKKGDTFYECQSGQNIEATVTSDVIHMGAVYTWSAVDEEGNELSYRITEGFQHYGPRLYTSPQYACFSKERDILFKTVNGNDCKEQGFGYE